MANEFRNRESRSWRRKNEQIRQERQAELIKMIPLQIPKEFPVSGSVEPLSVGLTAFLRH